MLSDEVIATFRFIIFFLVHLFKDKFKHCYNFKKIVKTFDSNVIIK